MKNFKDSKILKQFAKTCSNMYRLGWDERNGGNVSLMLDDDVVNEYFAGAAVIRTISIGFNAKKLAEKYFLVTGTGKYFKNVEEEPEVNLGVIRISASGTEAELVWGYSDGGKFTSELPAHLMSHIQRLKVNPANRVIMHSHPTNLVAMTFVHTLDEKAFTKTIWRMETECMVVFPDGIGVLPWMLCGNNEIGEATAEKMKDFRLVVWAHHGIYGAGVDLDEAFGLIETAEKAAEMYLKVAHLPIINTISDENLKEIAKAFKVSYKDGWVD